MNFIVTLLLAFVAANAYAQVRCTTSTISYNGRTVYCISCCTPYSCNTTCY